MAVIQIEDAEGALEAVVFPAPYQEYQHCWWKEPGAGLRTG